MSPRGLKTNSTVRVPADVLAWLDTEVAAMGWPSSRSGLAGDIIERAFLEAAEADGPVEHRLNAVLNMKGVDAPRGKRRKAPKLDKEICP